MQNQGSTKDKGSIHGAGGGVSQGGSKGVGGMAITGKGKGSDSTSPTKEAGVTDLTSGGDPYDRFKPKNVPAHNALLKQHSGEKVWKGGDSQAGSVGPYLGE